MIDQQVVRAIWTEGRLSCDQLLDARARLPVDLGAEFRALNAFGGTWQLAP